MYSQALADGGSDKIWEGRRLAGGRHLEAAMSSNSKSTGCAATRRQGQHSTRQKPAQKSSNQDIYKEEIQESNDDVSHRRRSSTNPERSSEPELGQI